jgi:tetratricopeptide (TPR) repeat protein
MEQLEQKYPGQRERSLLASVELSLRRLPSEVRAKLGPLAAFRGGGWDRIIGIALGLDIQKDEEITLARQLVDVGLAEELPYGYLQLDPALPAALARGQSAEQLAAARAAWRQATLALIRFLYQQQNKDPQMAATLTVLDLPNLLAALEESSHHALRDESRVGENVNPALELNLPSNVSSPDGFHHAERDGYISVDEFVQAATQLEGLLQNLGRPRALARVAKLRAAAARRLGDWSHARFVAESAAVDRLLESGRMQDALSAAQQLLERCQTAGETAFPEAPYDTAMVHIHIGRVLRMGGAAQAALETLAEARRRFTTLADAGNASAARMASACLTETGDCLQDIGRLDEAATAYEEAIELAESLDDDRQVAIGKGQLGTVRMLQGRHAEALAAWHDARRTFEQLGEPATVATAWHQIGMVHQEAGQYPAAEQAYQESLKIKVRMGNHQGEASTLLQLGTLYGTQKRTEEAVRFFGQAAAIYAEIGDSATEGRARNNIAVDLIRLHRHAEARQELLRAIECGRPYGHAAQPWKTFGILSDLERAVGDQAAAEAARQQARAAYLAYRRDGGQVAPGPGMQLCAAVLEAIQSHQIPAASAQLAALQSRTDLPAYLAPLLTALQAILSGRRDPALADNPSFNYADAAELLLLLERLSAPA